MARAQADTKRRPSLAQSRNAIIESSRRNAEAMIAMGMVAASHGRWSKVNRGLSCEQQARERRRRRPWRNLEGPAADAAVGRARRRRLARDPSRGLGRHHHRRLDPQRPGAGAGRSRHRQLARLCRRASRAGIGCRGCSRQLPPRTEPMPLQPPHKSLVVENATVGAAGRAKDRWCSDLIVHAPARQRPRRDRPERLPANRRSPACWSAYGRPLRGKVRLDGASLDQWSPDALGRAHRLSAAGCRTVHRHRGAKHRAASRTRRRPRGGDRGGAGAPASTT